MESLLSWLWVIPVAAVIIIGGLVWYRAKPHRSIHKSPQKRVKAKPSGGNEPSVDEIATATKQEMGKARSMEEVFAIGKEGLNKIKGQIKASKPKQQKKK